MKLATVETLATAPAAATLFAMEAWADEPLSEDEYPDAEDLGDEDEVLARVAPCPHCGCGVFEDAPRCPRCGFWIGSGSGSWRQSRKWYVRGGLWFARLLAANWIYWIAATAAGVIAFWIGRK